MSTPDHEDPRLGAAVAMLGRTGASEFQLRWSDDEEPMVWMAVAKYERDGAAYFDAAAAMSPLRAVFRLCETMIDGGQCNHCGRPTGFAEDHDGQLLEDRICWYAFDPELATFRRGCEGDTP